MIQIRTLAWMMPILLTACAVNDLHDHGRDRAKEFATEMGKFNIRQDQAAAIYIDEPHYEPIGTPIVSKPTWYEYPHSILSSEMPFYFLAEEMARKSGQLVKYGPDVNPNMPVSLIYESGTLYGAMEALSSATGYSYRIDKGAVNWSLYEVERFDLRWVGGKYNYLVGKEGDNSDTGTSGSGDSLTSVGSSRDQFQNIKADEVNIYQEIDTTIQGILNGVGQVVMSEASSSVVVRTTAARMTRVKGYMDSLNDALSRQVVLEVKVLKFRSSDSAAAGIDWNLVRQSASTSLNFGGMSSSQVGALFSGAPTTVSATYTGGGLWDASSLLISALQEQGVVSVMTEPRVVTQVNRIAELEVSELTGYIKETEVTPNYESEPSVQITPGTVRDGYSIYMLANVDDRGRIYLHISSLLSDLLGIDRKEVGMSAIETPNFTENKFAQTVIMRPGTTMVVNGLKQTVDKADAQSPFSTRFFSTYKAGQSSVEETLVLITPTVLDMSI